MRSRRGSVEPGAGCVSVLPVRSACAFFSVQYKVFSERDEVGVHTDKSRNHIFGSPRKRVPEALTLALTIISVNRDSEVVNQFALHTIEAIAARTEALSQGDWKALSQGD